MSFDAGEEATTIEKMARERLDAPADQARGASEALKCEWAKLTVTERDQVAQALEEKYSRHTWKDMPVPAPITDGHDHCVAIIFTAAGSDKNSKAAAIDLWTSSWPGKETAEISVRQSSQSNLFVPETKLATL